MAGLAQGLFKTVATPTPIPSRRSVGDMLTGYRAVLYLVGWFLLEFAHVSLVQLFMLTPR